MAQWLASLLFPCFPISGGPTGFCANLLMFLLSPLFLSLLSLFLSPPLILLFHAPMIRGEE